MISLLMMRSKVEVRMAYYENKEENMMEKQDCNRMRSRVRAKRRAMQMQMLRAQWSMILFLNEEGGELETGVWSPVITPFFCWNCTWFCVQTFGPDHFNINPSMYKDISMTESRKCYTKGVLLPEASGIIFSGRCSCTDTTSRDRY